MPDHKPRPLWPLMTAALLGVPVLYVASFGPVCWMWQKGWISYETTTLVARPIAKSVRYFPIPLTDALCWWVNLGGVDDFELVFLLVDASR